MNLEPVKDSTEVLVQDRENWECANTWLQQLVGWQAWYENASQ